MSDLKLTWDSLQGEADLSGEAGDFARDEGLRTAVLLSLFTDRRDDAQEDPRGWWADNDHGSRLWLLDRAPRTAETLSRSEAYAREALQWLIDDGIASAIATESEFTAAGRSLAVTVTRPETSPVQYRFDLVWEAT